METNIGKINIKMGEMEISIEGPSDFVSEQYDKIHQNLKSYRDLSKLNLNKLPSSPQLENTDKSETPVIEDVEFQDTNGLPETFGEWLNIIPKSTSETDKALIAGYFVQSTSASKVYRSREVSKLLKEHGVNLSNPSRFVKLNAENKRSFQVSKKGSEVNYRLSREGESYAKKLLNLG